MSRSGVCIIEISVGVWEGYEREAKFEGMTENVMRRSAPYKITERALNVRPLSSDPEYHPEFNPFTHIVANSKFILVDDLIHCRTFAHLLLDQRTSWGPNFLLERKWRPF